MQPHIIASFDIFLQIYQRRPTIHRTNRFETDKKPTVQISSLTSHPLVKRPISLPCKDTQCHVNITCTWLRIEKRLRIFFPLRISTCIQQITSDFGLLQCLLTVLTQLLIISRKTDIVLPVSVFDCKTTCLTMMEHSGPVTATNLRNFIHYDNLL